MAQAACPEHLALATPRAHGGLLSPFAAVARRLAALWQTSEEAEIRRYLARSGGRLTDSMERELMSRALHAPWNNQR
jgi:hypothetical protein